MRLSLRMLSIKLPGGGTAHRPTPLYIFTWTSLLLSVLIVVASVVDLGLWMNMSAGAASTLYHLAVIVVSARTQDVAPYDILTSVPTRGCASLLVFAWLVGFAMTILPLAIGRENFPGPPPLIEMAFPVHVALSALTGIELLLMIVIARLSGYPHVPTRTQSALQQRLALRPSMAARSLLGV
ncbi:hypothetical protein DFH08DRAFT_899337 [Mycena albidolilacea]|uniref:Uncharacterized protein n=1 Tax=Mycena albidolilacea TaxID=1033008 RepID=A0AAD7EBM3_9AGAR|nr:hypothetical protein DFH08DRAFT_899337 [Mycena albidolilacea]